MVGPHHSKVFENSAKMHRYGRSPLGRFAKTTGFPGRDALSKKRGSGTEGSKMQIPTRKARSLWFLPPETIPKTADPEPNNAQKC